MVSSTGSVPWAGGDGGAEFGYVVEGIAKKF